MCIFYYIEERPHHHYHSGVVVVVKDKKENYYDGWRMGYNYIIDKNDDMVNFKPILTYTT